MQFFEDGPRLRPVSYLVEAEAEPGMLPALLAAFACHGLCPCRLQSRRAADILRVEIALDAMPADAVSPIEASLRQIAGVLRVTVMLRAALDRAA